MHSNRKQIQFLVVSLQIINNIDARLKTMNLADVH
jgi:hypothetical protein